MPGLRFARACIAISPLVDFTPRGSVSAAQVTSRDGDCAAKARHATRLISRCGMADAFGAAADGLAFTAAHHFCMSIIFYDGLAILPFAASRQADSPADIARATAAQPAPRAA